MNLKAVMNFWSRDIFWKASLVQPQLGHHERILPPISWKVSQGDDKSHEYMKRLHNTKNKTQLNSLHGPGNAAELTSVRLLRVVAVKANRPGCGWEHSSQIHFSAEHKPGADALCPALLRFPREGAAGHSLLETTFPQHCQSEHVKSEFAEPRSCSLCCIRDKCTHTASAAWEQPEINAGQPGPDKKLPLVRLTQQQPSKGVPFLLVQMQNYSSSSSRLKRINMPNNFAVSTNKVCGFFSLEVQHIIGIFQLCYSQGLSWWDEQQLYLFLCAETQHRKSTGILVSITYHPLKHDHWIWMHILFSKLLLPADLKPFSGSARPYCSERWREKPTQGFGQGFWEETLRLDTSLAPESCWNFWSPSPMQNWVFSMFLTTQQKVLSVQKTILQQSFDVRRSLTFSVSIPCVCIPGLSLLPSPANCVSSAPHLHFHCTN